MNPPTRLRSHALLMAAASAGALAGSLGTLAFQHWQNPTISGTAVSAPGTQASPVRYPALTARTGDHRVKLSQIINADDQEHKSVDLQRLGSEVATTDQALALRMAGGITSQADRSDFLRGVVAAMADHDPLAAAQFALQQFSPGALQADALRISLGKWGAANPRDAYAWADSNLSGPVRDEAINALVSHWAANAPDQAAKWFSETGSTSQPLLTALVGSWAAKSPADAARWVETLPDAINRDTGRVVAAREWAAQNPTEAAAAYPNPPPELAAVLADIWGSSNPADAAHWVNQLPQGPSREEAAATLATVWAASDINAAAAWSANLPDPSVRAAAVEHIAATWGAIDPDNAIAWLGTQPDNLRDRGYLGAYNSWAGTDPDGLADWISQLPPSPQSDTARRSLGEVTIESDPAAAMDLALGMNPASQADTAGRWFRSWRRSDDTAAQDWLQQNWNSLPDATRARLGSEQSRSQP